MTHVITHPAADTVDDAGLPMSKGPKVARSGLGDRLQRRGYTFEITVSDVCLSIHSCLRFRWVRTAGTEAEARFHLTKVAAAMRHVM